MLRAIYIFLLTIFILSAKTLPFEPIAGAEDINKSEFKKLVISGHSSSVLSVAFSPDGKYLASGSKDNTIRLWSVKERREVGVLRGHGSFVASVAFSPDGKYLASGSWDNTIRLWSVKDKKTIAILRGHSDTVKSVAFSPDGKYLASGSIDKTIRLWSIKERKEVAILRGHSFIISIAFSPDGKYLASGSWDKTIRLWSVKGKKEVGVLRGHSKAIKSLAFSPDGKYLASGSYDKTIRLWSVKERKEVDVLEGHEVGVLKGHSDTIISVAFSPDSKYLASGSVDDTIRLWSVKERREVGVLRGHGSFVASVAFSPDGKYLASGSEDKTIRLWSVKGRREVAILKGYSGTFISIAFSPDGKYLASSSLDKTIRLWSVKDKKTIAILRGHSNSVVSVAFSPDGKYLASGSSNRTIRLWSVKDKKTIAVLIGLSNIAFHIAFSPDGKYLASDSSDNAIQLWSVKERRKVALLKGHSDDVTSIAFSPDGKYLASGSRDKTIRLWSVKDKKEVAILKGHSDDVTSVAFLPDGKYLASGSRDNTIRLWSVKDKKRVGQIEAKGDYWYFLYKNSLYRYDDGRFLHTKEIISSSGSYISKPFLSKKMRQKAKLKIDIPKIISIKSQTVDSFDINITNLGETNSYWIEAQSDDKRVIVYPNEIVVLKVGERKTLKVPITSFLPTENKKPFRDSITIDIVNYNGKVESKRVTAEFKAPYIQIESIIYEHNISKLRLKNIGNEDIKNLTVAWGNQKQKLKSLKANEISKPILFNSLKKPDSIDIKVYNPFNEWSFFDQKVDIPIAFYIYIIIALIVTIILILLIIYYKRYKNPIIVKLINSGYRASVLKPTELKEAKRRLEDIKRFNEFLEQNSITKERYEEAIEFLELNQDKKAKYFATLLKAKSKKEGEGFYKITLPDSFPSKLRDFNLIFFRDNSYIGDIKVAVNDNNDKLLLLSCIINQNSRYDFSNDLNNYEYSKRKTNGLIIPKQEEITSYLLSPSPTEYIMKILSNHISFKEISPYITSGAISNSSLFFGRVDIVRNITNKINSNYLIVGARQIGKSSLLKHLESRFKGRDDINVFYITMSDEDILEEFASILDEDIESIEDFIDILKRRDKKALFLIDEVDKFLKEDRLQDYKMTQAFRKISQEGDANFIFAGFWELYSQATLENQAPLKNFGELIVLEGLEKEACRDLMIEPMKPLGIKWQNEKDLDSIIEKCANRANLIATICDELLKKLNSYEIREDDIKNALESQELYGKLNGWGSLSGYELDDTLNRIIIYLTIKKDSFRLRDIKEDLESIDFNALFKDIKIKISIRDIQKSLRELQIGYILKESNGVYSFKIPLLKEMILKSDIDTLLVQEIEYYQYIYKAIIMIREGKELEKIYKELGGFDIDDLKKLKKQYG